MFVDTTIFINAALMQRIMSAVLVSGRSKNLVISSLMRRLADDQEKLVKSWSRVRYQQRGEINSWRRLHVCLRQDEYEFFLDMRKAFKCSVSLLVAYAIELYLDEILEKIRKNPDNYRYKNYIVSQILIDNVVCWMYCWGIPETLLADTQKFINQFASHIT